MKRNKDLIYLTYLSIAGIICSIILAIMFFSSKAALKQSVSFDEPLVLYEEEQPLQKEEPKFDTSSYRKAITEISGHHVSLQTAQIIIEAMMYACEKYDAPLNVMLSMCAQESKFFKTESYLGASYGRYLMMVSEVGLKDYNRVNNTYLKPEDLMNLDINIEVGVWCYKQNFTYLKNLGYDNLTYEDGVIAYNTGSGSYGKYKNNKNYNHLTKVNYYLKKYF